MMKFRVKFSYVEDMKERQILFPVHNGFMEVKADDAFCALRKVLGMLEHGYMDYTLVKIGVVRIDGN